MASQPARWFEEFAVGDRWETVGYTFTEAAIVDFALIYDPQPFHLDLGAAAASMHGGLIASGFQTLLICFRLSHMTGVTGHNIAGRGIDNLRWTRPVRPGDTLHVVCEVLATRASASRPDRGDVAIRYTAVNQHGETVMTADLNHIIRTRPAPD